jgi:hypothetical protein
MHQEHNIPWNLLAANLTFVRDSASHRTDLFPRGRVTQGKELGHFARVLASTISTFSETERAKYPASFDAPLSGKLFSDELRDRYPYYLNGENQLLEHWTSRAKRKGSEYSYSTSQGDLADAVKDNAISPLLMLAHHPQIPLGQLDYLSWGHHFGFSRVAEAALRAYLFFNVQAAADTLRGGQYMEMRSYHDILLDLTCTMDYDAQQLPHKAFLRPYLRNSTLGVHDDYDGLREYLKMLFSLLYRYDMVARECGVDPKWEEQIVCWVGSMWSVRTEYADTDLGCIKRFV